MNDTSSTRELLSQRDSLAMIGSYAVRGIGQAGLDVVATTMEALNPCDALSQAMRSAGIRGAAVRAWVVTRL